MRRTMLLLAAAFVLGIAAAPAASAQANDQNCSDFPYASVGGATAPGGVGGDALPFTGPGAFQLPAGMALLGGGLALVLGTQRRYRARHARR